MIARVWVQILAVMGLAVLPLLVVQHWLGRESIALIFDLHNKVIPVDALQDYQNLLKKVATLEPEQAAGYKKAFERAQELKLEYADLGLLKDNMIGNLQAQSLYTTLLFTGAFLILSLLLSRRLVKKFEKLLAENSKSLRKLETVRSLESWQDTARFLVHELKGSMMPLKLIATDLEEKYETLEEQALSTYLGKSTSIIRNQVDAIEKSIECFTRFGKLPPPELQTLSLNQLWEKYAAPQVTALSPRLQLKWQKNGCEDLYVDADGQQIAQIVINLICNALEASPDQELVLTFAWLALPSGNVGWTVANNGPLIPEHVVPRIFEPHVSTKAHQQKLNMGLGLAIAKKIALDHRGDLTLIANSPERGVVFQLELPLLERSRA